VSVRPLPTDALTCQDVTIHGEVSREGLSYTDIAQRRDCDLRAVTEFFRDIGTRNHRLTTLREFALALEKPADWLLNLLHDHGLH